jgi:transposase
MKAIPLVTVKKAIKLLQEGNSVRETAIHLKISPATVGRIRSDNKENLPINKGGRPRKIPAETVEYLKLNLKRGVFKTAIDAKNSANETLPQAVSVWTVRRRLREAGLIAKKIVKRPALKKKHISNRLEFVKKYREWTEEDWSLVVWSDESKINRICSDGIRYVWDDQPGRLTDRSVQGTVKFGGGSVMVWSCMSWYGPGYIAKIDETLDSQLYIEILKEDLQMSVEEWGLAKDEFIFQHDNDPKHTAKVTKAFLESSNLTEEEGRLLYWPAQSPDLNPIEHMWAYLKIQLGKYPTRPKSCKELWERISVEWYKIPVEFCRQLIRSMPRRLQAVHRAKGKHTKY